jgi:predicted RNA-binding protein with PIN domain
MILVIDGYNLLKQIIKSSFATPTERQLFITDISKYARNKNHTVVLVFDGGPYTYPMREKTKDLTIVYSGMKQSADEYIKNYIQQQEPSSILVVSSDKGLSSFAAREGVPYIGALTFYRIMKEEKSTLYVAKAAGKAQKLMGHESNPELDALMQEASSTLMYKDEASAEQPEPKAHGSKLSKNEKKLLSILKKL